MTILEKLLINAICFINFGGSPSIDINVIVDTPGLLVKVKDNGIGIEKEYFDRIFTIFWRASNVSSGLGFGLYLTGQIVSRMNGRLILESEIGSGSEFIFELPNQYYFDQV